MADNGKVIQQLKNLKSIGHVAALPAAQFIAKRARDLAPVDTGYMRDHIHAHGTGPKSAQVISEAPYSVYVEYGTSKMAAQPFMRPAVDQGMHEMLSLTVREINAEIRRRLG